MEINDDLRQFRFGVIRSFNGRHWSAAMEDRVDGSSARGTTLIDEDRGEVVVRRGGEETRYSLRSTEGFEAASRAWLRATWDARYSYSFTWMGRPIIQLPEDVLRFQEVLWSLKPDVLVETGIAHGGSLVLYASLFEAMNKGKVVGVDVAIRPGNRAALEAHPLKDRITLIEGSSTEGSTFESVKQHVGDAAVVIVVLDSNHTKQHVLDELRLYSSLVTLNSYIVATDGIMRDLQGTPGSGSDWDWNNPLAAAQEFTNENPSFRLEEPDFLFNEGHARRRISYWPEAFLKRIG